MAGSAFTVHSSGLNTSTYAPTTHPVPTDSERPFWEGMLIFQRLPLSIPGWWSALSLTRFRVFGYQPAAFPPWMGGLFYSDLWRMVDCEC